MKALALSALACLVSLAETAVGAEAWQPRFVVSPYAIAGETGPELYASIGENGQKLGSARAIAHTNWQLKWRRDYQPDGTACVLRSALPFLTITTTLPKPSAKLSGAPARLWADFIKGITAHEKVHGRDIIAMTEDIITATEGLRQENDPGCKAIRAEVLKRATAANEAYKAKSRAFDQAEMASGGNVHRLILALVNGR